MAQLRSSALKCGGSSWETMPGAITKQHASAEYLAIDEPFLYPLSDGADEQQAVAVDAFCLRAFDRAPMGSKAGCYAEMIANHTS